jgi:hypothetical protein
MKGGEFFNLYNHGFIRVAVGVPEVRVADPAFNGANHRLMGRPSAKAVPFSRVKPPTRARSLSPAGATGCFTHVSRKSCRHRKG